MLNFNHFARNASKESWRGGNPVGGLMIILKVLERGMYSSHCIMPGIARAANLDHHETAVELFLVPVNNFIILLPRFHTHETQTMPIIEHYQKQGLVRKIQAIKSPDEVRLSSRAFQNNDNEGPLTVSIMVCMAIS